ncbi:DUF1330 domain-containing protein [Erythrobacter sp. Alg231-14]|uniref:DUF1330 domain-containing protein n=1 Tax=Erythrobacter sp. Alg231-14 TaxID=1922225 RepID=UPI000D54BB8B
MNSIFKTSLIAAMFATSALAIAGNSHAGEPTSEPAPTPADTPAFAVEMKRGEVLQIIASELREGGGPAARTYGQTAFPIASSFGFQRLGQLNVRQNVISDFDPEVFSFFSWPDQASADAFAAHPDWPAIKATRPDAWSELKVYSLELQDDLSIQFDATKHYTVVVAWLNNENASDYDRYLTGIEPAVTRAGGRFVYKMRGPSMESHASPPAAPSQLTFVEWDSTDGFAEVQQSEEYLAFRQYFGSAVEKVEFYWLQTPQSTGQ